MKNLFKRLVLWRGYRLARKTGADPWQAWLAVFRSFWHSVWCPTGMDVIDLALFAGIAVLLGCLIMVVYW